ncbi:MAG: HAMP domain-containing histidine kinase [Solirubrobacterales bacterium]|nr:HAMP domain-containing histidine kinase [Solirubrobacterales bacterium]
MSRPTLARGLLLALGSALLVGVAVLAAYTANDAVLTIVILAPVGIATVAATHAVLARRERLGGLRRQALVTAALAFGPLAVALALFVQLMFVSGHDAFFTALAMAYSALLGLWAGRVLSHRVMDDVDTLRTGLAAVGEGQRELDLRLGGRDELAQVGAEVGAMVQRLAAAEARREDSESARRSLIAAVSHDLRTPVTALRLLAEAVDDEVGDPQTRREYVRRLGVHVRALGALIDDLFELTRIEAGEVAWTMCQVQVDELVEETVAAMRPAAEAGGVAVLAEIDPSLAPARANAERIQRVLFNLIQNAIRHTPADGSVTVRAAPGEGGVEIEVADTGSGIPAADHERVFEVFQQGADRAARTDGSAGLGLAISRAIVEAHGGQIWIVDVPGADPGARVRFSLPGAAPEPVAA